MTAAPNVGDGARQRPTAPAVPILSLIERKPQRVADMAAKGVTRGTDRADFSAEATRAGAELAQRLQSVREAIREASTMADDTVARAQEDLDRGTSALQDALGGTPKRRPELPTFRTQSGGVLLDARWNSIDLLGSTSKLTILVKGAGGSQMLSFASGTSLSSIAAAVDSFRQRTGVGAEFSPERGVVFRRAGSTGYTSINIVDDGGMVNGGFSLVP